MRNVLILVTIICAWLGAGCRQAGTGESLSKDNGDLVARIHFVGTTQIASDPKAAALNEIMALPATAPMVQETMQKLATTPYRMLQKGRSIGTNDFGSVIRPILDDLLHVESYAEMRGPTNHVPELLLAVRLDPRRAEYWRTNLATILTAWTKIPVTKIQAEGFNGWELKKHHNPNCIRFFQAGDWTLFGWGQDDLLLQPAMLQRIKSTGRPAPQLKDNWLDAWVDWPRITPYHPLPLPFNLPKMELTLEGKKEFIRPKLVMQFPKPLGISLEPWRIPTNTIRKPFITFTAVRGVGAWLNQLPIARELNIGSLPNQWTSWSMARIPFETCMAVPVTDATNYLKRIAPNLIAVIQTNLAARHWSCGLELTNSQIVMSNFMFLSPYLRPIHEPAGDFLTAGIFPFVVRKEPMPPDLMHEIMGKPKLVYYDWELTDERLAEWRPLAQVYLMLMKMATPDWNTPVEKWLLAASPKLKKSGTEVTLTAPNELTLVRNAPLGLSAFELTWLAYWLDAPNFPLDAHHELPPRRPSSRGPSAAHRPTAPPAPAH